MMITIYWLSLILTLIIWSSGASTIEYKEKVLRYTKIIIVVVKHLKVVANCCLNWIFHIALHGYAKYYNIKY